MQMHDLVVDGLRSRVGRAVSFFFNKFRDTFRGVPLNRAAAGGAQDARADSASEDHLSPQKVSRNLLKKKLTARPTRTSDIEIVSWGLIDYHEALTRQLDLVARRANGEIPDTLVFCSHPPVVTLGRGSVRDLDLVGWKGEVVEIQRGGKATYHGPGQVIGYPILDLKARGSDLHKYLRFLEQVLIDSLADYSVRATGDLKDATGVWIGNKKIASIGIGVKKWISYHGFALNLHRDPVAFTGINPCGFQTHDMTSLEAISAKKIPHAAFQEVVASHFPRHLSLL